VRVTSEERQELRRISIGNGASVSAVVAHPVAPAPGPATAVILAHGAGNDMHAPFLSFVHQALAASGYVAVKFNFPYKQRGGRAPDPAPVLEECYASVVEAICADARLRVHRLVLGGKSLGGRMASHLAAKGRVAGDALGGVLLLGYPLHPAGRTDKPRVAHLGDIRAPMLFFAGTRDALCNLDLLRATLRHLHAPVTLHVIDGADHSFNLPKKLGRAPRDVWQEIVDVSARWLQQLSA
jgi:predicted alpha/beta-hydrolase family hydrolase